jgi:DNA excision repair protein ERCC-3
MSRAQIFVNNARSRVEGLRPDILRALRYELSYQVGVPAEKRFLQADGSVKVTWWDGYKRLLQRSGNFPSGLVPRVLRLLQKWSVGHEVRDLRTRPLEAVPIWVMPEGFQLRDYQREACDRAEAWGRGVIDSPPRTGKSCMIAELVRRVADKTVITAPTNPIASQTMDMLLRLFRENDWSGQVPDCADDFYLLTGGVPTSQKERRKVRRAKVFVSTAGTAVLMPQVWWDTIKCLIVDERHHQGAKTYHKISDLAVNAYFRWGFTGTNYRSNAGEHIALEACLGRTVASYSIPEMTERGVLVPGEVEIWPVDWPGIKQIKYDAAYKLGIVQGDLRNAMVVEAVQRLLKDGRKVLVLVHRIKHGDALAGLIPGSRFVKGEDGAEVRTAVAQLDSGELRCLIGSPVVGEGLDCPAADALVYVKAGKARVTHTQDVFRVLTNSPGKRPAKIIDFADRMNATLLEHSVKRMHHYVEMGMRTKVVEPPLDKEQLSL